MSKEYFVLMALMLMGSGVIYFFNHNKLFLRWAILWMSITTVATFSPNFLLFTFVVALICFLLTGKTPVEKLTCYFLLLPVIPENFHSYLQGLIPGINILFELTYPRMLSLFILLPVSWMILNQTDDSKKLFRVPLDKFVIPFLVLIALLAFRATSVTEGLRNAFYVFIDIFLIYYAVSRSVKSLDDLKKIFSAFLFSAILLSLIGLFEGLKGWQLYHTIFEGGNHLYRGGLLRTQATLGHPIAFGFFMTIAVGVLFFLKRLYLHQRSFYRFTLCLLLGALFLTISRGPWLGCGIFFMSLLFLRLKKSQKVLLSPLFLFFLITPIFMTTPMGESMTKSLPFMSSTAYQSVDYRINLAKAGYAAVEENPLFGSGKFGYTENDNMREMVQGEGIIDLVNSYLLIALKYGLIGLFLFGCVFFALLRQLYRLSQLPSSHENRYLSHILFSIVLSIVVMLGVTGSSTFIPYYYWAIISLGAAFVVIAEKTQTVSLSESQPAYIVQGGAA